MSDRLPSEPFSESSKDEIPPLFSTLGGQDGAASIDLYLSADEMSLRGTFHPPTKGEGRLSTYAAVAEALGNLHFTGFLERALQEAIFLCNTEKRLVPQVLIAQGKPPKGTRPAYLKLEPQLYAHHFPSEKIAVDFKEYSPFIIVKKGELLARAYPAREGTPGVTVLGKEIPAGKKEVKLLKPGPHTIFVRGKVYAGLAGRFVLEGDIFDVSDTLEIKEGIDYSTGHVIFPGNISISGIVQSEFKLVSGGSITVKDTLDASEVICKVDLTCHGGIIGKKPGIVRVGHQLVSLFVENAQVEVLGTAQIHKAVLHAKVFCNGTFQAPEAKLVSSFLMSKGSAVLGQLGNEHGSSHVVIGKDFVVHRRLEQLREQYQTEEEHLFKIKSRLDPSQGGRLADYEKQTRDRLADLVEEMNQLTENLFNPEPVTLTVLGEIHPGVLIEMGYAQYPVVSLMKGKLFRLSDDKKTIVAEKAGKSKDSD